MCKLLAPFPGCVFCLWLRETLQPVLLCISAVSLAVIQRVDAPVWEGAGGHSAMQQRKGFCAKWAFCLSALKQCSILSRAVIQLALLCIPNCFTPKALSCFHPFLQGQELLSTPGHTCCLYCTLQFRYIKKSRTISVFSLEEILKNSRKAAFRPSSLLFKCIATSN